LDCFLDLGDEIDVEVLTFDIHQVLFEILEADFVPGLIFAVFVVAVLHCVIGEVNIPVFEILKVKCI